MKMYEVLLIVLFFNFVMFLLDVLFTYSGVPFMSETFANPATFALAVSVTGLLAGLATAAIINYIGVQISTQSYLFGSVIGGVYWSAYGSTSMVFSTLLGKIPGGFGAIIWAIITIAVGYVFVTGIIQMVTGGWKGYR